VKIRIILILGLVLVATPLFAQDSLVKLDEKVEGGTLPSEMPNLLAEPGTALRSVYPMRTITIDLLPTKPTSLVHEGDWLKGGEEEEMRAVPEGLISVARKKDKHMAWHVERINSCAMCGAPMTLRHAMFDKKASALWGARAAFMIADIEVTYHLPCFENGTCRDQNPLFGHTRLQSYSVGLGLTAISWLCDGYLRKGSLKYRIGGYRNWWIIPVLGYGASVIGITSNLSKWHR